MKIRYSDRFVQQLADDIAAHITGGGSDPAAGERAAELRARQRELAEHNCAQVRAFHAQLGRDTGIPDVAFRNPNTYLFADEEPVRVFHTSGTSGAETGRAPYTARGLELMDLAILANAQMHMVDGMEAPVFVRLVPTAEQAPTMVMAYGMQRIAERFGDAALSCSVVGPGGIELARLERTLDLARREQRPVVMVGGTFSFVNLCDRALAEGWRWPLPEGSRVFDAGGFKGRARTVAVDEFRRLVDAVFGPGIERFGNLFGMTELASQLYEASDATGAGMRAKVDSHFVSAVVREPSTLAPLPAAGSDLGAASDDRLGLLEVRDLAVLDRPSEILTGDLARAVAGGAAIVGRVARSLSRGCSLSMDAMTAAPAEAAAPAEVAA